MIGLSLKVYIKFNQYPIQNSSSKQLIFTTQFVLPKNDLNLVKNPNIYKEVNSYPAQLACNTSFKIFWEKHVKFDFIDCSLSQFHGWLACHYTTWDSCWIKSHINENYILQRYNPYFVKLPKASNACSVVCDRLPSTIQLWRESLPPSGLVHNICFGGDCSPSD